MQALPIYLTIPLFLVIIGVLVLVHEFGHFVTAKFFGVEAPEFGLGFPPRLVKLWHSGGWIQIQGKKIKIPSNFVVPQNVAVGSSVLYKTKRENNRDILTGLDVVDEESRSTARSVSSKVQALDRGTDFTLNAIPFGGFVRMTGEDFQNSPDAQVTSPTSFAAKPAWQRAIILVAGVTMNTVLAFVVFTALATTMPQPVLAATTQIAGLLPDSPAAQADLRVGDTIVSINGVNVKNNRDEMVKQLVANCNQDIAVGVERPTPRAGTQNLIVHLTPHPNGELACAVGVRINQGVGVKITHVEPGSIAAQIGLRPGDALVSIGDFQMVPPATGLTVRSRDEQDLADFIQSSSKVKTTLQAQVLRDGVPLPPIPVTIAENINEGDATLGLSFHLNVMEAAGESLGQMYSALTSIPRALRDMVANLGRGGNSGVVGPLGIGQIVAEGTPSGGLPFVINVLGVLSLNLAIFNLLPFPGLDGGRLAFVIVELLRGGRKVDPRKEGIIHLVGFMVLLGFILFVSYFDVTRWLAGKSPFGP
jgi:regulator of sigma E protease